MRTTLRDGVGGNRMGDFFKVQGLREEWTCVTIMTEPNK